MTKHGQQAALLPALNDGQGSGFVSLLPLMVISSEELETQEINESIWNTSGRGTSQPEDTCPPGPCSPALGMGPGLSAGNGSAALGWPGPSALHTDAHAGSARCEVPSAVTRSAASFLRAVGIVHLLRASSVLGPRETARANAPSHTYLSEAGRADILPKPVH